MSADPATALSCSAALADFLASPLSSGWRELAPFRDGRAAAMCARIDARIAAGEAIAPPPSRIFAALAETPFDAVKVLILGQDPYPTRGNANGLAFSYVGPGRLPRSLANIFRELGDDLGSQAGASVREGDLTPWAQQGVLLLNAALTVAEGAGGAGAHLKLGWGDITEAIITGIAGTRPRLAALLWGAPAIAKRPLIDESRHLVIASAHPSPLSARRGFFGSRPFSRTNRWLQEKGLAPIDW
jgi:uracil-DNA glycosylase